MTLPDIVWPVEDTPDPTPADVGYILAIYTDYDPGGVVWRVSNDPAVAALLDSDGPGLLVDPITISRSVPQSDLWPLQPDPATATFTVVTPNAEDIDPIKIGANVAIYFDTPTSDVSPPYVEEFHGRVADVATTPGLYKVPVDGTTEIWHAQHTVTCVDYLADNAEDQVRWGVDYLSLPGGTDTISTTDLIDSIFDQLNMGDVVYEDYGGESPWPGSPFVRVPANTTDTGGLELLEQLLMQWALDDGTDNPARYVLDQNINLLGELDPDQPYVLRVAYKKLPATADDYLDAPDPDHMTVIDGNLCDLGSTTYAKRKYDGIRRVVAYPDSDSGGLSRIVADLGGSGPHPTIKIATTIVPGPTELIGHAQAHITDLAYLYLPPDVPRSRWAADQFLWRFYKAPAGSKMPPIGAPLSVAPIATHNTPTGLAWYTGRLVSYTFTLAGGRPVYELSLRDLGS